MDSCGLMEGEEVGLKIGFVVSGVAVEGRVVGHSVGVEVGFLVLLAVGLREGREVGVEVGGGIELPYICCEVPAMRCSPSPERPIASHVWSGRSAPAGSQVMP